GFTGWGTLLRVRSGIRRAGESRGADPALRLPAIPVSFESPHEDARFLRIEPPSKKLGLGFKFRAAPIEQSDQRLEFRGIFLFFSEPFDGLAQHRKIVVVAEIVTKLINLLRHLLYHTTPHRYQQSLRIKKTLDLL